MKYVWTLEHWVRNELDEVLAGFGNPTAAKQYAEKAFPQHKLEWDRDDEAQFRVTTPGGYSVGHLICVRRLEMNPVLP
ncbi:hypothetical protein [Nocardia nova]|uniref:hypothetical protein n=1 Tax=Nocardia nova TaxID=37330 RepID=UPI002739E493|nr:hypothetical protein [Nocardia nova]